MKLTVKKNDIFKTLRSYSMVIVLVLIAVLFQQWTGGLTFKPRNITNIIQQQSYIVILILGMLPVILTGNVDLSVGSTVAFVGAVAAVMQVKHGYGTAPTLLVSLLVGAAIGAWNGLWIARFDIPAFIVTLSSQLLFRGFTLVVLDGNSIGPFNSDFRDIASSFLPDFFHADGFHLTSLILGFAACAIFIFIQFRSRMSKIAHGVPVKPIWGMLIRTAAICAAVLWITNLLVIDKGYPTVLIIMLALSLIYTFICNRTIFGRSLYAIGGNRKAAALSGIKDRWSMFLAYTNMGFVAAIAALVYAARLNVATPKAGTGFELDAIAACYVGGASVSGGAGTIGGALIGCFVIGILNNGMSLLGISPDWQQMVKGLVILAAVAFDLIPKMKKK